MARLSKEQLGDRGRFRFNQEEVELPELQGKDDDVPTVLVRTPSVGQRDALAKQLPDNEDEWTVEHTALLFATIVVDPDVSEEEAKEFIADWPGTALDKITAKWTEMIGSPEVMRESAGDFQRS
jgi:hypothetical protein